MKSNVVNRGLAIAQIGLKARQLKQAEDERVKATARDYLIRSMGKLKGLPHKMGQILSMSDKMELDNEFTSLCNQGTALSMDVIHGILQSSWKQEPESIVDWIEEKAFAASLGQVHKAQLKDGRIVAIKVLYPDIQAAIKSDLKLLGWLSIPVGGMRQGFDMDSYQEAMLSNIEQELDYIHEAQEQLLFRELAQKKGIQSWIVPALVPELCTDKVLVSEWEEGENIAEIAKSWPEKLRFKTQQLMASIFCSSFFEEGIFHADPHPGNYAFRKKGEDVEIIMYDFGCTGRLDLQERLLLLKLFQGAQEQGNQSPYPIYLGLGFSENYLEPLANKLPALTELLFEPFLAEGKYDFADWHRAQRAESILGDDRWNFRVAAPAKALFILRAFTGFFYYQKNLKNSIWLYPYLKKALDQQQMLLSELPIEKTAQKGTYWDMAKYLKLRVEERGQLKVQLTMKRSVVDNLEEVIPEDTLEKIKQNGIDLEQLVRRVQQNLYQPGELFYLTLERENKSIRVWLE